MSHLNTHFISWVEQKRNTTFLIIVRVYMINPKQPYKHINTREVFMYFWILYRFFQVSNIKFYVSHITIFWIGGWKILYTILSMPEYLLPIGLDTALNPETVLSLVKSSWGSVPIRYKHQWKDTTPWFLK